MIESVNNSQFFKRSDFDKVINYCKAGGFTALIFHETKKGKYRPFTKNMLTRRLKAANIAWVHICKPDYDTLKSNVQQEVIFLSDYEFERL